MPGLNGLRLIRQIRDVGNNVPIIAISGVNADQLLMAEDYGANVTLFKPVDRELLLQLVAKLDRQDSQFWVVSRPLCSLPFTITVWAGSSFRPE